MRDGRGVPQVHVVPQKGGHRGARSAVLGVLCALGEQLQGLLFCAPAQAWGWLGPEACGHLGALRAPVGARWCGRGHRFTLPAEVAGVCRKWEAGDKGSRRQSQGLSQLWRRGSRRSSRRAPTRRQKSLLRFFLPDCLPGIIKEYPVVLEARYEVMLHRAGVSLGRRHIGVTSA